MFSSFNETFGRNIKKILARAEEKKLDGVILMHPPNMYYVSGIREPTGFILLSNSCGHFIGTSILDYSRIANMASKNFETLTFFRRSDEKIERFEIGVATVVEGGMKEAIEKLINDCKFRSLGVDKQFLNVQVSELINNVAKDTGVVFDDMSNEILKIRSVKEDWEIDLMIHAQRIAEKALKRAFESLNDNITEREIAGIIKYEMLKEGAWAESFSAIVAFHENSAYPHHTPGDRVLGHSGPVLIDLGALYRGYASDMTRTFWWGSGGSKFRELLEAVLESQSSGIDAIAPGVPAWEPDNAARKVLEKRGLSKYFIHGLGHGVGVEVHENPYLRPGSKEVLEPGNVVTAEPGVYITGLYGVRIEDMVLVTKRGKKVLSSISRLLL